MTAVAGGSALAAFAMVYALSWRDGGLNSDRLVLIGIGTWLGFTAISTLLIVGFDPWNTSKALTWLSGPSCVIGAGTGVGAGAAGGTSATSAESAHGCGPVYADAAAGCSSAGSPAAASRQKFQVSMYAV